MARKCKTKKNSEDKFTEVAIKSFVFHQLQRTEQLIKPHKSILSREQWT